MRSSKSRLDILISEISRTDSLDWREFHFFKQPNGLSKNSKKDSLEMLLCLDYERALECRKLVKLVCGLNPQQREHMLSQALRYRTSQFVPLDAGPAPLLEGLRWPPFRSSDSETMRSFPPIPTACVAASWFPNHWLTAPVKERGKIIKRLGTLYGTTPLAAFDFPMENQREAKLLIASANAENSTRLYVFAINKAQTESALITAFKAWLKKHPDITGAESRQGKVKIVAALHDLGCYRLMTKLDASSRQATMDEVHFNQSVPKLSEGKRRAEKRLRALGYI